MTKSRVTCRTEFQFVFFGLLWSFFRTAVNITTLQSIINALLKLTETDEKWRRFTLTQPSATMKLSIFGLRYKTDQTINYVPRSVIKLNYSYSLVPYWIYIWLIYNLMWRWIIESLFIYLFILKTKGIWNFLSQSQMWYFAFSGEYLLVPLSTKAGFTGIVEVRSYFVRMWAHTRLVYRRWKEVGKRIKQDLPLICALTTLRRWWVLCWFGSELPNSFTGFHINTVSKNKSR